MTTTRQEARETLLRIISLAYDEDDPSIPWDERCVMVGDLAAIKHLAGQLMDRLLTGLRDDLPEWEMTMEGVGTFTKSNGSKTVRSDGKRLAHVVAARTADAAIDLETGQVPPAAVVAGQVADELVSVFGLDAPSKKFKRTEVRRRGLNPDTYSDSEDGTPTVIFKAAS